MLLLASSTVGLCGSPRWKLSAPVPLPFGSCWPSFLNQVYFFSMSVSFKTFLQMAVEVGNDDCGVHAKHMNSLLKVWACKVMQPCFSWEAWVGGCSWGRAKAGWSAEEQDSNSNGTSNLWKRKDYHWFLWDLEVLCPISLQIGAGLQGAGLTSRASLENLCSMSHASMQCCLCPAYLCSLGISPTFQIPVEKIFFSAPVTGLLSIRERQRACSVFSQGWWLLWHLLCWEVLVPGGIM